MDSSDVTSSASLRIFGVVGREAREVRVRAVAMMREVVFCERWIASERPRPDEQPVMNQMGLGGRV